MKYHRFLPRQTPSSPPSEGADTLSTSDAFSHMLTHPLTLDASTTTTKKNQDKVSLCSPG